MFRVCCLLFLAIHVSGGVVYADSIPPVHKHITAGLSASFTDYSNWNALTSSSHSFNGKLEVLKFKSGTGSGYYHTFIADLGVTRFADSAWIKSADRLQVQLQFRRTNKNIRTNYSLLFSSQLFDDYRYVPGIEGSSRILNGTFLLPFDLELGYGFAASFWGHCSMNVALATIRVRGLPNSAGSSSLHEKEKIIRMRKGYMVMSYGMSGQWYINRSLNDRVEWNSNGRFFVDGFNRESVGMFMSNTITFSIWKYLKLIIESVSTYNSFRSYKMQYRNQFMLGWYYTSGK